MATAKANQPSVGSTNRKTNKPNNYTIMTKYRIDVQGRFARILDNFGRTVHQTVLETGETYAQFVSRTQLIANELAAYKIPGGKAVPTHEVERIASKYAPNAEKQGGRFAFDKTKTNKPKPWQDMGGGTFRFHGVSM